MKKSKYVILGLALLMALGGCGSEDAKEDAERANQSNQKIQNEKKETFVFEEEDGEVILTEYNGKDSDVEIPEEYNNQMVTAIAGTAFKDYGQIKNITIPSSVRVINENALPAQCGIHLHVYGHTMGEIYAIQRGLEYTILGENPMQASEVVIYNKEGSDYESLSIGKEPEKEFLKGITFQKKDGKSVLALDNCDIGSVAVEQFAALTIELKEGSVNTLTGARGNDGISVNGSLTITGDGTLNVYGSDLYSMYEGERNYLGGGIYVFGNLTVEEQVQLMAKAGSSKSYVVYGILVEGGNLIVNGSRIEAFGTMGGECNSAALSIYNNNNEKYGKLELTNAQVAEGGELIPMTMGGATYGYSLGNGQEITYDEILGYVGASSYIRIEPQAQN